MSTQRFRRAAPTPADIAKQITSGLGGAITVGPDYIDIPLANDADLADLQAYMTFAGFAFVQSAPTTSVFASATPQGHVDSLALGYFSATEVTIAAGTARAVSNDFDIILTTPLLTLDITDAGVNGLDTGVEAPDTWYAVYLIGDSTLTNPTAGLLSTNFAGPVLPAGYDKYRRVGCVRNDGAGDFIPFRQIGADCLRRYYLDLTPATSQVLAAGADAIFTDVDLSAFVPPTAPQALLLAEFSAGVLGAVGDELLLRPNGFFASVAAAPVTLRAIVTLAAFMSQQVVLACPGQIIEYRVTDAVNNTANLSVIGFDDVL